MGLFRRKKKQDKESTEQINTNKVKVIIWRSIGKDLYALASEFEAVERPDQNTNLIVTNEDKRFKEEVNFSKDRVYEILEYNLELVGKDIKTQQTILDKKIKERETLIKKFESEADDEREKVNKKYNFQDEDAKLRQMRVLRDSLKYQKLGAYERIGKNGIRQYEFESKDGVLYPFVFGGTKSPRAHPDFTVKKKIFNHENTVFNQQLGLDANKILTWISIIMIGIACIWSLGNGFWTYKIVMHEEETNARIDSAGIACNNAMAVLTKNYANYVSSYPQLVQDIENLKNNKDTNNNKNSEIVINPNNK